ncbi:MAG: peptidoglycan-associated lipoprotein Pal [Bacteroidales bacterium]
MRSGGRVAAVLLVLLMVMTGACGKKKAPATRPMPPPPPAAMQPPPSPPAPPQPVGEQPIVPSQPVAESTIDSKPLDELNREGLLKPVFFQYDESDLSAEAQQALNEDAALLKQHPTWVVTIEGHCDERGTAEYNLALGERRAVAARTYLVSLGIAADRLHTVSYGKEFPFDPGHTDAAWAKNRRAHFVITAK